MKDHLCIHLETDTGGEVDEPRGGVVQDLGPGRCSWPGASHRITDEPFDVLAWLNGPRASVVHTVFILRGVPAMVDPAMRGYVGDS